MARIAVIVADMFEDSELTEPLVAFRDAGHMIVTVGIKAGATVAGKRDQTKILIDRAAGDVAADEFDALLIPGGYSPEKLRADGRAVAFARMFFTSGKPVFAICHGPQLLISADVLQGRRLTGWKSIVQDIHNAGAEFVDAPLWSTGIWSPAGAQRICRRFVTRA